MHDKMLLDVLTKLRDTLLLVVRGSWHVTLLLEVGGRLSDTL
jgi:hypothetical protein